MTSLKQIEANRRNAEKSTGPTTPDGKLRSRRNAVRHGLTAETVIPTLEDADDYQAFELAITSDYDARTAVERELVLRLASVFWRLRRANRIETDLLEGLSKSEQSDRDRLPHLLEQVRPDRRQYMVDPDLLASFVRAAELAGATFDRVTRYEYLLWRQARQLILALETLRRRQQQLPAKSRWRARLLQYGPRDDT